MMKLKQGAGLPVGLVGADTWFVDEDAVKCTVR
jgi:hypothetical protein